LRRLGGGKEPATAETTATPARPAQRLRAAPRYTR
jgi:hypothetical protein